MPTKSSHHNQTQNQTVNVKVNVTAPPKRKASRRKPSAPAQPPAVVSNPVYNVTPQSPLPNMNAGAGMGGGGGGNYYIPHQSTDTPDNRPPPAGFDTAITNRQSALNALSSQASAWGEYNRLFDTYETASSLFGDNTLPSNASVDVPQNVVPVSQPQQPIPLVAPPPQQAPPPVPVPAVSMSEGSAPSAPSTAMNTPPESSVYGSSVYRGETGINMADSDAQSSVHPLHQDVLQQAVVPHPYIRHVNPIVEEASSVNNMALIPHPPLSDNSFGSADDDDENRMDIDIVRGINEERNNEYRGRGRPPNNLLYHAGVDVNRLAYPEQLQLPPYVQPLQLPAIPEQPSDSANSSQTRVTGSGTRGIY